MFNVGDLVYIQTKNKVYTNFFGIIVDFFSERPIVYFFHFDESLNYNTKNNKAVFTMNPSMLINIKDI